jgi:alcohol dehydrogenase (cytochrome c)
MTKLSGRRIFALCVLAGSALLLLAGVGAIVVSDQVRMRAQILRFKVTGQLPEVRFSELVRLVTPSSGFDVRKLAQTANPFGAISAPKLNPAALEAGRVAFERNCAACHGTSGQGGAAPALVGRQLSIGAGDWSLYRTITDGRPERGMPTLELSWQVRWQIIGFLKKAIERVSAENVRSAFPPFRPVSAQMIEASNERPGDWLTYSGSYDGARHSELSQINSENGHRLKLIWMQQVDNADPRFETTPLAVGGILFSSLPQNGVQAMDGETGRVLWTFKRSRPAKLSVCCGLVNRGVAILGDSVFVATLDAHLLALDARSGQIRWDVAVDDPEAGYSLTLAPLAVKDLVVTGTAGGEFGAPGHIDAYDARTGKHRWRFNTIPAPGEPGADSWSGNSARRGGAPAWMTGSYDPRRNLIYWGIGNPNPDFDGTSRQGDNLYSNSFVALDAGTGKLRWHFQFTPHDVHDWDAAAVPVLAEGTNGQALVLTANKNGFYYVLDRTTGQFVSGTPFMPVNWASGLDERGRPRISPQKGKTVRGGTLVMPGSIGATNWWPPSYDSDQSLFFVQTLIHSSVFFKGMGDGSAHDQENLGGSVLRQGGRLEIRALDAMTGRLKWRHELVNNLPSYPYFVGGLLSTNGNILFGGAQEELVMLDSRTGKLLWKFHSGPGVHAAPMTYLVKGQQRITVAVGHTLLTFGLDGKVE